MGLVEREREGMGLADREGRAESRAVPGAGPKVSGGGRVGEKGVVVTGLGGDGGDGESGAES